MTTESDRELLELAAKAAGIDARWFEAWEGYFIHEPHRLPISWKSWNPMRDDGDALRLAVKLDLSTLMIHSYDGRCGNRKRREFWSPNSGHDGGKSATTEAEYEADPYAATRRAIVRAAAEIGRGSAPKEQE